MEKIEADEIAGVQCKMEDFVLDDSNIFRPESNITEIERDTRLTVSLRCPHCSTVGSFQVAGRSVQYSKAIKGASRTRAAVISACIRICPNPVCHGIVFTVEHPGERRVLPPELIDFDPNGLPANLLATLKEAISCHAAEAYRAAAMMVRRLLEEICDESGAQGKDLHARLIALKSKITLPEELFDAMGELKALGNDAAHITAKNYISIGKDES